MRKLAIFALTLLFITAAIGCGNTQAEKPSQGKALDFELKDIKGNTLRLSDYSGRVILLNFFATWCPPCRVEMPDFDKIAKEYKDDVTVIAINISRESPRTVQDFVSRNNLTFTVAIDDGSVSSLYGPVNAIPVTVIIDKDFNIAKKYIGMRKKEVFVRDIEGLL